MIRWEYKCCNVDWEWHRADKLGGQGYELVAVVGSTAYFKRPIKELALTGTGEVTEKGSDEDG
jgi:hypothetical protein